MGRKKQFTVDASLKLALGVFAARGYHATSIMHLATGTGMSRSNVYAILGDKRTVFLKVLRHYAAHCRVIVDATLAGASSPRQAILDLFDPAGPFADADTERGSVCLLINTALELSPHDLEVTAIVRQVFADLERYLCTALERAQALAEIPRTLDIDLTARALLSLFTGRQVLARSRPDDPALHSIASQAAAFLR